MKLTSIYPQIKADKVQLKKSQDISPAKTAETKPTAGTDRVELSSNSIDVQKMKEILQETPDVRMEKVQALKEQIEKGEYQVDPYRVADKMLMSLLTDNLDS